MPEQEKITAQASTERWKQIRENPKCDLSLTAMSVASYLGIPESELVQERIRETLVQLARYRLGERDYVSVDPPDAGDLATCEGLETFLVPAVEEAMPISSILVALGADERVEFAEIFIKDVNGLLKRWESGIFSGKPYADENEIAASLLPTKDKTVNIVEAAAMASRVIIHLLTLKLIRTNEKEFQQTICKDIKAESLFRALENAIEFLIRSFQKADGHSEEDGIARASVAGLPGSGWSWAEWPGLPPMLFFTAAAVDAFAELDLYLVRAVGGRSRVDAEGWQQLADFHTRNKSRLEILQFCVDMARRWVQHAFLDYISDGAGMYPEPGIVFKDEEQLPVHIKTELESEGIKFSPTLLYSNLYAMQVLLWSWADWDDRGQAQDQKVKGDINRALTRLIYNYDSVPAVKTILRTSKYYVELPRHDKYQRQLIPRSPQRSHEPTESQPDYLDKGFLPLLTRLLVLFVVYGVGDRNLLEPVIRTLYVELLQSRNRTNRKHSALWSSDGVEVFATQRAIQALTFYFAYARGKEKAQVGASHVDTEAAASGDSHNFVIFRNRTGKPLMFEAVTEERLEDALPTATEAGVPFLDPLAAANFSAYIRLLQVPMRDALGEAVNVRQDAAVLGKAVLAKLKADEVKDPGLAKALVYALACLSIAPATDGAPRTAELELLSDLARQLSAHE